MRSALRILAAIITALLIPVAMAGPYITGNAPRPPTKTDKYPLQPGEDPSKKWMASDAEFTFNGMGDLRSHTTGRVNSGGTYGSGGTELSAAAAAARASNYGLLIAHPITISTAVGDLCPTALHIIFEGGGKIILNTGGSITLGPLCSFTAPLSQVFALGTAADFSGLTFSAKVDLYHPEWWGGQTSASIQAAIDALPATGGEIRLAGGAWNLTAPIVINKLGVRLIGEGYRSVINVNHTGDAFQISNALARFEKIEIQVGTASSRVGSAIWNVQAGAFGGRIHDIRVTGMPGSTANGMIFREDTHLAGSWDLDTITISGGHYWTSVVRLSADATLGTCASHRLSGIVATNLYLSVAGIDVEGAIDTLTGVHVTLDVIGAPVLWTHTPRPAEEQYFPRWVHFTNSYGEARSDLVNQWTTISTIPAIQVDSGRDVRWVNGYLGSASYGVKVGPKANGTTIAFNQFINLGRSALTIASGAIDTTFVGNNLGDVCIAADNTYDAVSIAANASGFRILHNEFANTAAFGPRYHVGIAAGTGTDFEIVGNRFRVAAKTANLSNSAAGADWTIFGNPGVANSLHSSTTHNFDGAVVTNQVHIARGGIQNDAAALDLAGATGYVQIQGVPHGAGTAAPGAGTHFRGEIVWNTTPSASGPPGWVCTTGGTPGTWKAMASLAP